MRHGVAVLVACSLVAGPWSGTVAAQPAQPPAGGSTYNGPTEGVVRLPWADFRELVDQLRALQQPEEAPPPADSVIGSAVYRVTVDAAEEQAKVEAEVELVVLKREGWVDVPLLPDTAALEAFAVDGRSATLTQSDGFHRLIAQAGYIYYGTPTARKVTMTYRLNVQREEGPHGLVFPMVQAGITRIELTLPRPDQEVRIEPGGVVLERTTGETGTTIVALVPRTSDANIRWSDRAAPIREEPLRAVADVVHRVAFQRHVVSGEVTVALQVERGSFEAVVLRFPKEAEGIRATGDFSVDVAAEGDAAQLATVRSGYARREATRLVVRYEMARNVGKLVPPDVKIVKLIQAGEDREIVRQAGFLVLHAAEGMEVRPDGPPAGAEPCDVSEVPGTTELTGQAVLAYRTSGQPCAVPVEVTRHDERAVLASAAQSARLDLMINREGKAVGDLVLSVQNNERQFLGVWLPGGAQLWATFVRGMPVKPSGEKEWVMIPVPRSIIGADGVPETIPVEVLYYQDVPRIEGLWGDGTFDVPRVDLLVSAYEIAVWVPDEFRYFGFEGDAQAAQESVGPVVPADFGHRAGPEYANMLGPQMLVAAAPAPDVSSQRAFEPPSEDVDRMAGLAGKDRAEEDEHGGAGARAAGDEAKMGRRNAEELRPDDGRDERLDSSQSTTLAGNLVEGPAAGGQAGEDFKRVVTEESRGLLPIRVDVPRSGLLLRFARSLVEPKDRTVVEFRYQGRTVLATFPWLRALAGLLLALGLARIAHRSIARRRFSMGAVAPVSFAAGLALTVVLAVLLRAPIGGVFWALLAGVVLYGAAVGALLLWNYWREHKPFGPDVPQAPAAPPSVDPPPPAAPVAPAAAGAVTP